MPKQPGPAGSGDEPVAAAGGTTRAQISGYNFLVRRMEHAIVRRDVRMLFDPMRSQSRAFAVGVILASLGLAGCAVLALVRPQDKIGSNKILVGQDSGAMYVVLGDTIHPVLNLASARLAVGSPDKPAMVKESELGKHPVGQLIGIPGAPSAMPYDKSGNGKVWTVCDDDQSGSLTTSVIVGDPVLDDNAAAMDPSHVLLVQAADDYQAEQSEIDSTGSSKNDHPAYLVYQGKRAQVDRNNPAIATGLDIAGVRPRPVSRGLLNSIPLVPQLTPPTIAQMHANPNFAMQDGSSWPSDYTIGSVLYTAENARQYYVVLSGGLQKISEATSSIILAENYQNAATLISPTMQANAPVSTQLAAQLADYPDVKPTQVDTTDNDPVACLSWKPLSTIANRSPSAPNAALGILDGRRLPVDSTAKAVTLIQPVGASGTAGDSDTAGDIVRATNVYCTPGSGDYIQTTGVEPTSQRSDALFYITPTGVAYGIDETGANQRDATATKALGLDGVNPEPAPAPIVALLGTGPTLSRKAAMVAHDGLTPDQNGVTVPDTTAPAGN